MIVMILSDNNPIIVHFIVGNYKILVQILLIFHWMEWNGKIKIFSDINNLIEIINVLRVCCCFVVD